jgi:hypothetical protein
VEGNNFFNILKKCYNIFSISFFLGYLTSWTNLNLNVRCMQVSLESWRGFFFNLLKKYTNVSSIFFFFRLPDFLDEPGLEN